MSVAALLIFNLWAFHCEHFRGAFWPRDAQFKEITLEIAASTRVRLAIVHGLAAGEFPFERRAVQRRQLSTAGALELILPLVDIDHPARSQARREPQLGNYISNS